MKCWMRLLRIELTSKLNPRDVMVFGNTSKQTGTTYQHGLPSPTINDCLTIKVDGTKYPATNKDKGVITIINLAYDTLIKIKLGMYYKIKILCGYSSWNKDPFTIFEGEVAHISQKIYSAHDTETYIQFASKLVASYSQNRMNFTLNSGINVYSAMAYMLRAQGVQNKHIDPALKNSFINEVKTYYGKASTILDSATLSQVGNYDISTDGVDGNVIDITTVNNKRTIHIDSKSIPIGSGNPTVSSEGLAITLLPLMNFKVGDILHIDNALIDISINSADVTSTFNSNYMDTNGKYIIYELRFTLENRGNSFQYNIKARALDIIKNLSGVSTS